MNRINPLKSFGSFNLKMKIENLILCLLPSAIRIYLHTAWMSPACSSDSWGGVRAFWSVWTALGPSQFPFPGSWDGVKALTAITAMTHRPALGRGNEGWRKKRFETKFWEEEWQEMRMQQAGSFVGAELSKVASLSLVSKSGKHVSQDAARKSRKDIYLQHQQLLSFFLAQT